MAFSTASTGLSAGWMNRSRFPFRDNDQVRKPTIGMPSTWAWPISERVPYAPPTAITALPARTTIIFRAHPIPVQIGMSTHLLASAGSIPGRIPIVVPPAALAPLHAASITPPSPPQATSTPRLANSWPTCSANSAMAVLGRLSPITEIINLDSRAMLKKTRLDYIIAARARPLMYALPISSRLTAVSPI